MIKKKKKKTVRATLCPLSHTHIIIGDRELAQQTWQMPDLYILQTASTSCIAIKAYWSIYNITLPAECKWSRYMASSFYIIAALVKTVLSEQYCSEKLFQFPKWRENLQTSKEKDESVNTVIVFHAIKKMEEKFCRQ